jgi:hypothetical protein
LGLPGIGIVARTFAAGVEGVGDGRSPVAVATGDVAAADGAAVPRNAGDPTLAG